MYLCKYGFTYCPYFFIQGWPDRLLMVTVFLYLLDYHFVKIRQHLRFMRWAVTTVIKNAGLKGFCSFEQLTFCL